MSFCRTNGLARNELTTSVENAADISKSYARNDMKKEHRIAFRSVLELVALRGIKVDTALRRISAIIGIIEDGKSSDVEVRHTPRSVSQPHFFSSIGRCTKRPLAA